MNVRRTTEQYWNESLGKEQPSYNSYGFWLRKKNIRHEVVYVPNVLNQTQEEWYLNESL
jgi:hypothetical protein